METSTSDDENDDPEIDSETADPLWEPEQLKQNYEKMADDDVTSTKL